MLQEARCEKGSSSHQGETETLVREGRHLLPPAPPHPSCTRSLVGCSRAGEGRGVRGGLRKGLALLQGRTPKLCWKHYVKLS